MMSPNVFTDRGVRTLCKVGLVLLALVAVLWVLLLAALRFVVVPNIEGFRPKLTDILQTSIGRQVEIGGLGAGWEGWNPRFVLHELKLKDAQGNVALRLPKVEQVVSWRSLLNFQLTSRTLIIDGLKIVVTRDENNQIAIAGIDVAKPDPNTPTDSKFADWLLAQRSVSLRNAEVVWVDALRKAPPIALNALNARLVNSGNRHRLGVTAEWSESIATPVQFVADLTGASASKVNEWSGRTYLRIDAIDVARAKQWLTLPFPVQSGVGGVQVWAELDQGVPNDITLDVKLNEVRAQLDGARAPLAMSALAGRMQWSEARGRNVLTNVRAENLQLTFPDKSAIGPLTFKGLVRRNAKGEFEKSELFLEGLDLASSAKLVPSLPMPERFGQTINALALKGQLGKTTYEWEGDPKQPRAFNLATSFEKLSVTAIAPFPGVTNVSGAVKLTQEGGEIDLSGSNVAVDLPSVFVATPKFDTLRTAAKWSYPSGGIELKLAQTELANADLNLTLAGTWARRADEKTPGRADLSGVIGRAKVDRLWTYLPTVIETDVREFVRQAFLAGNISRGEFVLRGPLDKFPFPNDAEGQWAISAKADDVTMDYADNWPKATDADISIAFNGSRMVADILNAKISGIPLRNVRASIPDMRLSSPQLSVIGTANGQTREFLKFVDESPVGDWIEHFTKGMGADGDGQLALAFELPLGVAKAKAAVRGDYEFRGNQLALGGEIPAISDVRGKLSFTERGVTSQGLQGRVLGGPASFVLQNVPGGVKVSATGQADIASVIAQYPIPHLERATGTTDWAMEVDTPSGGALSITSSMRGVKIEAPAPIGKLAEDATPLVVTRTPLADKRDEIQVKYGETVRGRLRIARKPDGAHAVETAALAIGGREKVIELPSAQKLSVLVAQADIVLDPWIDFLGKLNTPKGGASANASASAKSVVSGDLAPSDITIEGERVSARGIRLNQARIVARPVGERWTVSVRSREADGEIVWSPGEKGNGAVRARLSKLVVADRADGVTSSASASTSLPSVVTSSKDTSNWPAIDISTDAFTLRGNAMGRLELKAAPLGEHWRIESLVVSNPDAELKADGVWTRGEPDPQTILTANLAIADTQKYFSRLGLGEGIREAKGSIGGKIGWAGSPLDFEMRAINGEFNFELGQGRFTKAEPGIAKLLGILSLQSLARRIVFDTRDLFSDGFSFDKATAVVAMKNGILTTDNLDIYGPTARVEIRGSVSLPAESQELQVRVLPDVTTSIAVGAGVVTANPLIAAGAFVASKVFKDPLDRMFSVRMRVSGTWADPKVDPIERGGGKPEGDSTGSPSGQ